MCITYDPAIPLLVIPFKGISHSSLRGYVRGCSLKCASVVVAVLVWGGKELETILNWSKCIIIKMKNYVTNSNNRLDIHRAWLVYTDIHRTTMLKTVPSEKEMRIIIQYHLHKLITHT